MRFGRNPNSGANTDNTRLEDTLNEATRTQVGTEDEQEDVEVALESLSQWQLAWRRFRRHRLAMIGVVILTFMVLVAIFGPILQPYNPNITPPKKSGGDPPVWPTHVFGTTRENKDVFNLVVNGARISMIIGIVVDVHRRHRRRRRGCVRRLLRRR